MLVKERMTRNPITIRPDTPVTEAQAMMKREKIHHLPVMDKDEKLVGVVSEKDLLYASPSPASTLSVYEIDVLAGETESGESHVEERGDGTGRRSPGRGGADHG